MTENIQPDRLKATADLLIRIEEARKNPLSLFKLLASDETGNPCHVKWFHQEWVDLIMTNKDLMIAAPRESGKTTILIYVVLWMIGRNPNIRIKWLGENDSLAVKRLATIHEVIDKNHLYHLVFPGIVKTKRGDKRPNNATQLNVERTFVSPEPTVEACGVLSAGTGGRADILIGDDVCGATNTMVNPSLKPKVISKWNGDWHASLVSTGRVIYIHTPWAQDDLSAYLKKHSGWAYKKYKHGTPKDPYHSIFPERWPREVLIQRRRQWGAIHYARAYLCEPLGEHMVSINPEHLRICGPTILTESKVSTATAIISLDPASGKEADKGKLDYFGVTIGLLVITEDGEEVAGSPPFEVFIVDSFQLRIPLHIQAKLAWQLVAQWEASYLLVEAKGMQSLDSWLTLEQQRNIKLPPVEIVPITFGSTSKGQRLSQAAPLLDPPTTDRPIVWFHPRTIDENPQAGTLTIDGVSHEVHRELREQTLSFPVAHDDTLDSFTQLLNWIRMHFAEGTIEDAASASQQDTCGLSILSI